MPVAKLTPTQVAALHEVLISLEQAKELRDRRSAASVEVAERADKEARYTLRAVLKALDEQTDAILKAREEA